MSESRKSILESVWSALSSIKFAIIILIIIAASSVIGTVLKQNASPEEYVRAFGPRAFEAFRFFGINDLYHSWWFELMLILLSLSILVCSADRIPALLKSISRPSSPIDPDKLAGFANKASWQVKSGMGTVVEGLERALAAHFSPPSRYESGGRVILMSEKGVYSRIGPYLVHLSIILILLGALIGSFLGYRATVNIVEGEEADEVYLGDEIPPVKLGFKVRCEKFTLSYYPGSERPKEYKSDLKILDGGRVVASKQIVVNDPLSYKGITFYQSSYGTASAGFKVLVKNGRRKRSETRSAGMNEKIPIIGVKDDTYFMINDFVPDYHGFGPAAMTTLYTKGEEGRTFPVFYKYPNFEPRKWEDLSLEIVEYREILYTGLQATKDPGVWVVWAGCFFMIAGLSVTFFSYHRRIWVIVSGGEKAANVTVVGTGVRNNFAFVRQFRKISRHLGCPDKPEGK
jgi:cytochrome c biogenesis protein